MTIKTIEQKKIISQYYFANVLQDEHTHQNALHTTKQFKVGDIIIKFYAATTQSFATYLTVQTGINTHITLEPKFLQYINHSCNPTVFFNTTTMELICLTDVEIGDELTFFYPSTEWNMSQSFICNCKNNNCLGFINGASYLDKITLAEYRLTDFIKQQLGFLIVV